MKTSIAQVGLVAALVAGGLILSHPVATQGASLSHPAGGTNTLAKQHFQTVAAELLESTPEQKEQLKPILRDEAQQLKTVRAETGLTRQAKRAQLKQIRQDLLAKIRPILTPEQLAKWQQLRAQMRAQHHTPTQP